MQPQIVMQRRVLGFFFDEERPLQRAQGGAIEAVKAARGGRVGDGGGLVVGGSAGWWPVGAALRHCGAI